MKFIFPRFVMIDRSYMKYIIFPFKITLQEI